MRCAKRLVVVLYVFVGFSSFVAAQADNRAAGQGEGSRWYKGNTHAHTLNSDGDSTPDEVARWTVSTLTPFSS